MGNTQTQEEYLAKLKKQFKKALEQKKYDDARSFLIRIEHMDSDDDPRRRGHGNLNSWIENQLVKKTPNRVERRKNLQRKGHAHAQPQPLLPVEKKHQEEVKS